MARSARLLQKVRPARLRLGVLRLGQTERADDEVDVGALPRRVHREAHERVAELLYGGDEQMAGLDGDDFTADLLAARRRRRVARAGAQIFRRDPEQLAQRTERLVGRPR